MANKTCLLIDDDPDDQEIFGMALNEVAPSVTLLLTNGAEEGLELLREMSDPPDFIFLDLNMPRVDGYEFLVRLKREIKYKRIPVVVYSTSTDPKEVERTKKLGATDFFTKTPVYQELCDKLQQFFKD